MTRPNRRVVAISTSLILVIATAAVISNSRSRDAVKASLQQTSSLTSEDAELERELSSITPTPGHRAVQLPRSSSDIWASMLKHEVKSAAAEVKKAGQHVIEYRPNQKPHITQKAVATRKLALKPQVKQPVVYATAVLPLPHGKNVRQGHHFSLLDV